MKRIIPVVTFDLSVTNKLRDISDSLLLVSSQLMNCAESGAVMLRICVTVATMAFCAVMSLRICVQLTPSRDIIVLYTIV